jgi:hypothetical protein
MVAQFLIILASTGHFLIAQACPPCDTTSSFHPITVALSDGSSILYTGTASVHLPPLPAPETAAHVFPHLHP